MVGKQKGHSDQKARSLRKYFYKNTDVSKIFSPLHIEMNKMSFR